MKITDETAKKIVRALKCYEVKESIKSFPEEERDGRSDLDIIREEIEYFIDMYEDGGTVFSEDLERSRRILKATRNGKEIPLSIVSFRPLYSAEDIALAKNTVSEYKQLKRLQMKLKEV